MVVMAVSKTQIPWTAGFCTTGTRSRITACRTTPSTSRRDSADYPCLGIDKRCIYQTNAVINA